MSSSLLPLPTVNHKAYESEIAYIRVSYVVIFGKHTKYILNIYA